MLRHALMLVLPKPLILGGGGGDWPASQLLRLTMGREHRPGLVGVGWRVGAL